MSSNIRIPKICQYCGKEYIAKTTVTLFCSNACSKRAYKKRLRDKKLQEVPTIPEQKQEYNLNQINDKHFLSISETCELLGTSRMTLYRQIKSGNIHAAKIGSRTIIKRTEIEKLFQS